MKLTDCFCKLDGDGYWSKTSKWVKMTNMELRRIDYDPPDCWSQLDVTFRKKDWNNDKYGLIYTDDGWLTDFRIHLRKLGFSKEAVNDIGYSESGMQGEEYVNLDVGKRFIAEYLLKECKNGK